MKELKRLIKDRGYDKSKSFSEFSKLQILEFLEKANCMVTSNELQIGNLSFLETVLRHKCHKKSKKSVTAAFSCSPLTENNYEELLYFNLLRILDITANEVFNYEKEDGVMTKLFSLFRAIDENDIEAIKMLVKLGIDINDTTEKGYTPLFLAARNGYTGILQFLLKSGGDIEARYDNRHIYRFSTSLHIACEYNHADTATILLKKGADIHAKDFEGNTPLHLACKEENSLGLVKLLVKNGADIEAKNNGGKMPINIAKLYNYFRTEEYLDKIMEKNYD